MVTTRGALEEKERRTQKKLPLDSPQDSPQDHEEMMTRDLTLFEREAKKCIS
jgi:hypothetical protein